MTNKEDRDIEVAALKFLDSIVPLRTLQNDESHWGRTFCHPGARSAIGSIKPGEP